MTHDRDLPEDLAELSALSALDPTVIDAPPAPGSTRHRQILERAMTTTDSAAEPTEQAEPTAVPRPRQTTGSAEVEQPHAHPHRTRRRWLALAAAAAVVVAIVGVVVLIQPDRKLTPAAALAAAADNTGDITTLRVHAEYTRTEGGNSTIDAQMNGGDSALRQHQIDGPPQEPADTTVVNIGSTVWSTNGDRIEKQTNVPEEERNAPYQASSRAVVDAALTGSKVTDLGRSSVRDGEADHYRIELTRRSLAALTALPPSQTAQFELEYPSNVRTFEVWVDGGLIRRIELALASGRTTTDDASGTTTSSATDRITIDYYDFGADITIRPPT